jgi:hypothetical protein
MGGGSKSPAKEYAKQPYTLYPKEKTEAEKAREVEIEQEKAAAWMDNLSGCMVIKSKEPEP